MRIEKIENEIKESLKSVDKSVRSGELVILGEAYDDVRAAARSLNYTSYFPYMFVVQNNGETIEFYRDDVKSHDLLSIGPLMQKMYDMTYPRNETV